MSIPKLPPFLTKHEQDFLELFGSFYETRGMPFILGQLIGLLVLKAPSAEKGLDQQLIATYLDRSVSSTSRMLKSLKKMKMCEYVDVINEKSRRERKHFISTNIGELIISTLSRYVIANQQFIEQIKEILLHIRPDEEQQNEDLIRYGGEIIPIVGKMKEFWSVMVETVKKIFQS